MDRIKARRRRRYFQTTMRVLCPWFLLLMFGAVGGMEQNSLDLWPGFLLALAGVGGFGLTAWLGGLMQ